MQEQHNAMLMPLPVNSFEGNPSSPLL